MQTISFVSTRHQTFVASHGFKARCEMDEINQICHWTVSLLSLSFEAVSAMCVKHIAVTEVLFGRRCLRIGEPC